MPKENAIKIRGANERERERESKPLRGFVKFLFSFFLAVTLFLTAHSSVYATNYYVDSAITDTNPASVTPDFTTYDSTTFATTGGSSSVYKTIADINLKSFSAGDNIYFRKSQTWNEQLTIAQSGTVGGGPITFGAFGSGNKPIIDAQNTRSYSITFGGLSYITIDSIQVQNSAVRNIWSDSVGSNITLTNIDSIGGLVGIWLRQKSSSTYTNITVNNTTGVVGFRLTNAASNVTVTNVTSSGNAGIGIDIGNITNFTASGLTAKNNTGNGIIFQNMAGTLTLDNLLAGGGAGLGNGGTLGGITVKGSTSLTFTITNSTSSYNTSSGLRLEDLRNGSISGTVDNLMAEYNGGNGVNIELVQNVTISNSIARYSTGGNGIATSQENNNITIENCVANNNYWDGISFHGSGSSYIINKSTSYQNGNIAQANSGDGFTSHDTVTGVQIKNSIAYGNLNSGVAIIGSTTGTAYHNTFYNNGSVGFNRGGYWSQVSGGTGWTIKDNIFSNNYPYEFFTDSSGISYTTADYNTYYHTADNKVATVDNGVTDLSWTTYHTTDAYETHSVYGDPQFLNTSSPDFHIAYSSSAINIGVDVGLTTDKDGNTRPQGSAYDAGAYEFLLPAAPTSLAQYKSDGTTTISSGAYTNEGTVVLKFNMSSSNSSDSLTPQIEIQPNGTSFTNSVTNSGSAVAFTGTAVTGSVTVTGLTSGISYHWQARINNTAGNGSWVSIGGSPDFIIDTTAPTAGSLSSPTGFTKDDTKPTLVFKKSTDSGSGLSSYSVSLDSGNNRSFSTSGIPTSGNGSADYVWKNDSSVKVEFLNENDSDASNDEIHVYFKDLDNTELTEGKHTWTVTTYDAQSNSVSQSADFYIDRTSPSISELAVANVSLVKSGETYKISILNRTPSFSGLASDSYQGSTKTNSNNTIDTFDKVCSGPQTITLTLKRQKNDKTYADYLTQDYSLSNIQDISNDKKSTRFYITVPFPLIDGYYQSTIVLKDSAGNTYTQPIFYLSINNNLPAPLQSLFNVNLETKITEEKTVPAQTEEEKQQVKENGYIVKIKVVDTKNKPVPGAKVTIHSKVQETTTDKNGIALFNSVEPGQHKILIAYSGYTGEQSVNLTGDVKEFDFNIQVKEQNAFLNPKVILVIGIMALIILATIILLIKARKNKA